ncbi:MAG: hypothetical protein GKC09_11280, partial [Methanosarcinales archaeon]|nr:hypothetical protein [Methanosarcinales archaeon]
MAKKSQKQEMINRTSLLKAEFFSGFCQDAGLSDGKNSKGGDGMHRQFLTATSRIFVLAALTLIISCCFAPANAETKSTDNEWKIQIDLPAEQIFDMAVTEIIPTGLIYLPESLSITGSAANPDIILSGANDGNSALTIIWKFGDIDNSNNEDVDIRFHVAVANVDRNQEGTILSAGKATLNWKDS